MPTDDRAKVPRIEQPESRSIASSTSAFDFASRTLTSPERPLHPPLSSTSDIAVSAPPAGRRSIDTAPSLESIATVAWSSPSAAQLAHLSLPVQSPTQSAQVSTGGAG